MNIMRRSICAGEFERCIGRVGNLNRIYLPGGIKGTGMLVGKLELSPSRRPIWAWLRLHLTPKGDHAKTDNQIRDIVIERCEQRKGIKIVPFLI